MFFNPIGKVDLTVRIEREIPVGLPSGATPLPIRLVYEGRDITRASIVQVEILNSGSTPIGETEKEGEAKKRWKLDLKNRDGVAVVPLGTARSKPENLKVDVVSGPSPDLVSLEIGLLNPGDSIFLELMLVEPKDGAALPVIAEARIPGLHEPVTGRRNVRERLRDAFLLPMWIVAFSALSVWSMYAYSKRSDKKPGIALAVVSLMVSLFASVALALGSSWLIAWFAANVLSK